MGQEGEMHLLPGLGQMGTDRTAMASTENSTKEVLGCQT